MSQEQGNHSVAPRYPWVGKTMEGVTPWEGDGYPLGEDFINEGRGFSPTHLKFFLLFFSQIKRNQREDQA